MRHAVIALCLVATPAISQVIRCETPSGIVYQQAQCEGGRQIGLGGASASPARAKLVVDLAREQAETAIAKGQVFVGMTREDLARSWGQPTTIRSGHIGTREVSEEWVYRREKLGGDYRVFLGKGVVRRIEMPE
jgi:hypothetical protein